MMTRSRFYRLALDANEQRANVRDVDVLPIPTLDERATLYLRAVHGNRDFTEEERSNARNVLLDSMAAEIAAQVIPAEQSPVGEHGADRGSLLAQYAAQYWQSVQRKEAIKVAPIARRRTSILALTAAFGLVLIVTGGTLGYRWTHTHTLGYRWMHPQMTDEVTAPTQEAREAPPTTSPRSLSTRLGLNVTEGNVQVPIAIPDFVGVGLDPATARDVSQIIASNLRRSGLFAPIDPGAYIEKISTIDTLPRFPDWRQINAQALVTGRITQSDGRLRAEFRLWNVFAGQQ